MVGPDNFRVDHSSTITIRVYPDPLVHNSLLTFHNGPGFGNLHSPGCGNRRGGGRRNGRDHDGGGDGGRGHNDLCRDPGGRDHPVVYGRHRGHHNDRGNRFLAHHSGCCSSQVWNERLWVFVQTPKQQTFPGMSQSR